MRKFFNDAKNALSNECGGPNVEQLIGIAVALAVGAGLFVFGRSVYKWFNGCAGKTVESIQVCIISFVITCSLVIKQ